MSKSNLYGGVRWWNLYRSSIQIVSKTIKNLNCQWGHGKNRLRKSSFRYKCRPTIKQAFNIDQFFQVYQFYYHAKLIWSNSQTLFIKKWKSSTEILKKSPISSTYFILETNWMPKIPQFNSKNSKLATLTDPKSLPELIGPLCLYFHCCKGGHPIYQQYMRKPEDDDDRLVKWWNSMQPKLDLGWKEI